MKENQEPVLIDKDEVINMIEDLKTEIEPATNLKIDDGRGHYYDGMFAGYNRVIKEIKKEYLSDDDLILKWLRRAKDMYYHKFYSGADPSKQELKELRDLINRLEITRLEE